MIQLFDRLKTFAGKPAFFFRRPWYVILLNVALSAVMMVLYEPFGYRLKGLPQFFELLGFTFIAFLYSFLFFRILPERTGIGRKREAWTVAKLLLYLSSFLFLTGLSIFLYDFHIVSGYVVTAYGGTYFWNRLAVDVCGVFSIGIFPLYVAYLLEKNHDLRKNLDESLVPSDGRTAVGEEDADCIVLTGDTKESLKVRPADILFVESAGNYVNIYYNPAKPERKTLRTTIKHVETLLQYECFVRCHRTYIVNVNHVEKFGRIPLGYRIWIKGYPDEIPVSRTCLSQVRDRLNKG